MAGLPRIARAMIRTGLTFAAGVGAVTAIVGTIVVLAGGSSFREMVAIAGKFSVVAFLLGIGFSGILAITARSRRLAALSIPRFASLGAGAGLLYFAFIAINGGSRWSVADAVANLAVLTVLGGGSPAGTLMLARRGSAQLKPGEESRLLDDR